MLFIAQQVHRHPNEERNCVPDNLLSRQSLAVETGFGIDVGWLTLPSAIPGEVRNTATPIWCLAARSCLMCALAAIGVANRYLYHSNLFTQIVDTDTNRAASNNKSPASSTDLYKTAFLKPQHLISMKLQYSSLEIWSLPSCSMQDSKSDLWRVSQNAAMYDITSSIVFASVD